MKYKNANVANLLSIMKPNFSKNFKLTIVLRWCHTLRYLAFRQVFFRIYYPFKFIFFQSSTPKSFFITKAKSQPIVLFFTFTNDQNLVSEKDNSFNFLNKKKFFGTEKIDWHFLDYGLLWQFHLHYFDYLNDSDLSVEFRVGSISQWIDNKDNSNIFTHSYPASLRIINWIKFLLQNDIDNNLIYESLHRQAQRLSAFVEYNIMGNHLLVNAISLVWAGVFFDDKKMLLKGSALLRKELNEQILTDGIHFEKSLSYQSIITKQCFETIVLLQHLKTNSELIELLKEACTLLNSSLSLFQNKDGFYPNFGDANDEMSINFNELSIVAQYLRIFNTELNLHESGYRILQAAPMKLFFNLGNITSTYQPGHSHADAFSFCLYQNGAAIIVDRGVSTYNISDERNEQKATNSHNTICINNENSTDVWASFRVGDRAKVLLEMDNPNELSARLTTIKKAKHKRQIKALSEAFEIIDELNSWNEDKAVLYLHFYPDVKILKGEKYWTLPNLGIHILLDDFENSFEEEYDYCVGFNKILKAKRIVCRLSSSKHTSIIKYEQINRRNSRCSSQFYKSGCDFK